MSNSPGSHSKPSVPNPRPDARRKGLDVETAREVDSAPAPAGPFNALPTQFGRYRVEKLLGKGAMGAVYLAHDSQLDRPVALKVARVSVTGSARLIQRMETEAKAAAKVDHPQICKVYDFGEIDGIRFIALQYIEGDDLKSYLKRVGRKREPSEAVSLVLQIARALEAAHAKDVIHRDLKPENIMLNQKGEPVIMDFGLARRMSGTTNAGLTQGMILGTAAYMSPEQASGKAERIDHRSDLYALGVMLFEMLTGEWPFTGAAIEVMGRKSVSDPPSPLTIVPSLSPQLATVCHKMIARKKEDRYATCAEVIAALEAVDLKVPAALKMEVEPPEAPSPFAVQDRPSSGFLDCIPVAIPSIVSTPTGKKAIPAKQPSSLVPVSLVQWWLNQPLAMQWTVLGCAGVCGALLAVVLFFRPGDALVTVEVHAEDVEVTFQKETLTLADGTHQFKVKPSVVSLHIKSGDVEFDTEQFTVERGENPVVAVEIVKSEIVTKLGDQVIGRHRCSDPSNKSKVPMGAVEISDLDRIAKGKWIRLVDSQTVLPDPGKMRFENGVLELNMTTLAFPNVNASDVILRAQVRKVSGQNVNLHLRRGTGSYYGAFFSGTDILGGDFFGIGIMANRWKDLTNVHTGRKIPHDQFVEMAFAAIGETLTLYVDGTRILTFRSRELQSGIVCIGAHKGKCLFQNVEFQIVNEPPVVPR